MLNLTKRMLRHYNLKTDKESLVYFMYSELSLLSDGNFCNYLHEKIQKLKQKYTTKELENILFKAYPDVLKVYGSPCSMICSVKG